MNKRGYAETTEMIIVSVLLIIAITASILLWMSDKASGKALESEVMAKQAALLIDSAEPGTTIFVNYDVVIEGNKAVITENGQKKAEYSFFNKAAVEYKKVNGGTEITVK